MPMPSKGERSPVHLRVPVETYRALLEIKALTGTDINDLLVGPVEDFVRNALPAARRRALQQLSFEEVAPKSA